MLSQANIAATIPGGRRAPSRRQIPSVARFALVMVLLAGAASSASAGHYQKSRSTLCSESHCSVGFGKVKAGKRLKIGSVSCTIRTFAPAEVLDVRLSSREGQLDPYRPVLVGTSATQRTYALNQQTTFHAEAGDEVVVGATSDSPGISVMFCRVTGELRKAD